MRKGLFVNFKFTLERSLILSRLVLDHNKKLSGKNYTVSFDNFFS